MNNVHEKNKKLARDIKDVLVKYPKGLTTPEISAIMNRPMGVGMDVVYRSNRKSNKWLKKTKTDFGIVWSVDRDVRAATLKDKAPVHSTDFSKTANTALDSVAALLDENRNYKAVIQQIKELLKNVE